MAPTDKSEAKADDEMVKARRGYLGDRTDAPLAALEALARNEPLTP